MAGSAATKSTTQPLSWLTSGAFDLNGQTETIAGLDLQGTGIGGAGALVNSSATSGSTLNVTGGITLTGNATIGVTQSTGEMSLGTSAVGGNFALDQDGAGHAGHRNLTTRSAAVWSWRKARSERLSCR